MRSTYWIGVLALCGGCTCNSPNKSMNIDYAADRQAEEKLRAFEIIVTEFRQLPNCDDYYRKKPQWEEENLHKEVLKHRDRIDGMLVVFALIPFDPSKHPEMAKRIAAIFSQQIDAEEYGCPAYAVVIMQIAEAILPILKFVDSTQSPQ
jgi:hypothetical protein